MTKHSNDIIWVANIIPLECCTPLRKMSKYSAERIIKSTRCNRNQCSPKLVENVTSPE
jgi:hypothetical protein